MANRYANLVGTKKISEDFNNINIGFDRVQAEMDTKGTPADAQAKADAAKAAAIAAAAADLAAHKARGADEHPTAKGNAAGFMSAADKLKSDASTNAATPDTLIQRDTAGRAKVAAPAAADDIARKAETDAVQTNLDSHAADTDIHVTADDHDKLDGIAAGAEVNQNAFAKVNDVEASSKSDTLQLTGGTGITVTTDPATKRVIVTSTGTATPGAHASSHVTGGSDVIPDAVKGGASGLMSGADAKFVREDAESKTGAQAKADEAEIASKAYTDGQIEGISDRLDNPERTAITLQPGIQIVQANQEAPFSLTGLTGRTLVNLLGRDGNCESIARWLLFQGSAATDNTNKTEGMNGIKLTVTSGSFATATAVNTINAKANKFYLAIVDAKNGNATNASFYSNGLTATKGINTTTDATQFVPLWRAYAPTADVVASVIIQTNSSATSQYAYFDAVRFYEITAAEYAALDSMTPQQVAAKYPYVDSVQPVRNPYAIRYGENLLPPFYEYVASNSNVLGVVKPYVANVNFATQSTYSVTVPVISGQRYTLALSHNGRIGVNTVDDSGNIVADLSQPKLNVWITDQLLTFTVPAGATKVKFNINNGEFLSQPLTFSNPMLTIGNVAKPFKPREDAMLALQTDLYADPSNGANADELFEKDGQYFKLKKWQNLVFDGSLGYTFGTTATGIKKVNLTLLQPGYGGASRSGFLTKYDGKLLNADSTVPVSDTFYLNSNGVAFTVAISGSDSGWGDSYTPTADEIKAYFMGWKMYDVNTNPDGSGVYNRTDGVGKWFVPVDRSSGGVNALPTSKVSTVASYQLLYQLATPVVESITYEGQLTFNEGNNQVEVGTGIVLRERANTQGSSSYSGYYINETNVFPASKLRNKADKILAVYRNSAVDFWKIIAGNAYGNQLAFLPLANFDPSAAYSVTYLMLDKYPAVDFAGTYAENEKALLMDAVKSIQENTTRISVLESKKAEKDSPAWITATLINGATGLLQYKKMSSGLVALQGIPKVVANGVIAKLPTGYRPADNLQIGVLSSNTSNTVQAWVQIGKNGDITVSNFGTEWVSLGGITFPAE